MEVDDLSNGRGDLEGMEDRTEKENNTGNAMDWGNMACKGEGRQKSIGKEIDEDDRKLRTRRDGIYWSVG